MADTAFSALAASITNAHNEEITTLRQKKDKELALLGKAKDELARLVDSWKRRYELLEAENNTLKAKCEDLSKQALQQTHSSRPQIDIDFVKDLFRQNLKHMYQALQEEVGKRKEAAADIVDETINVQASSEDQGPDDTTAITVSDRQEQPGPKSDQPTHSLPQQPTALPQRPAEKSESSVSVRPPNQTTSTIVFGDRNKRSKPTVSQPSKSKKRRIALADVTSPQAKALPKTPTSHIRTTQPEFTANVNFDSGDEDLDTPNHLQILQAFKATASPARTKVSSTQPRVFGPNPATTQLATTVRAGSAAEFASINAHSLFVGGISSPKADGSLEPHADSDSSAPTLVGTAGDANQDDEAGMRRRSARTRKVVDQDGMVSWKDSGFRMGDWHRRT